MPPTRKDRNPEPATAIRAELAAYGLWLEIEREPGTWEGVYLPTRTVCRLVTASAGRPPADPRQARPADLAAAEGSGVGLNGPGVGRGSHLGSDHAPSLHHHKE